MKIAIGSKIIKGPWGGGNLFSKNLKVYLENNNINVVNHLIENDIDIILLTEPRIESSSSTITSLEALMYKKFVNKNVKIIHRINECDERKETKFVNKKMIKISRRSDFTIYVSQWLKDIYDKQNINIKNSKIIMSGSDGDIFNSNNKKHWDRSNKLKIITHHWGNNWNKGFDMYSYLDKLLESPEFKEKFEFTYIGNLPENFKFNNSIYKEPMNDTEISTELKLNDLYITGSLNEPSGNHQIEASMCGLPVMYINSGGISEYQKDYGIEYDINNFTEKLQEIYRNYDIYFEKNSHFPFNASSMCKEYLNIFKKVYVKLDKKKYSLFFIVYKLLYDFKIIEKYKNLIAFCIYQIRKFQND